MSNAPSHSNATLPAAGPSRFARPAGLRPLMPAPRSYFRRAVDAVGSATKKGADAPAVAPAARPSVFRRSEPALRLFGPDLALSRPWPDNTLIAGARVTLTGAVDGASEKLLYDLGLSRIAVETAAGPRADELTLRFSRRDLAAAYLRALESLRYINWSARPTAGERRVVVDAIDIDGALHRVGDKRFTVASAFAVPVRAQPAPERPAEIVSLAPLVRAPFAPPPMPAPRQAPPVGPAARAAIGPAAAASNVAAPKVAAPKVAAPSVAAPEVAAPAAAATKPAAAAPAPFSSGLAYRIFGPATEKPATERTAPTAPSKPLAAAPLATPIDMVWTPDSGRLPPRLDEVRPVLSLDDLFGSEHGGDAMLAALARRDRPRARA
jgi:hypothetical protein